MNRAKKIALQTKTYTVDAIGQRIPTVVDKPVFAYVRSASQSEFFNAGEDGLKPDKVFDVRMTEYANETELKYGGDTYVIYRTYLRDDGRIELHTEKRVGK
jgi:SPP1 family predicted phage head-tail adaptor